MIRIDNKLKKLLNHIGFRKRDEIYGIGDITKMYYLNNYQIYFYSHIGIRFYIENKVHDSLRFRNTLELKEFLIKEFAYVLRKKKIDKLLTDV